MKIPRLFIFLVCIIGCNIVAAQGADRVAGDAGVKITYSVLADSNYTFPQILAAPPSAFTKQDSLNPAIAPVYWLKIYLANPAHFHGQYSLHVTPALNNAYYYFDAAAGQWQSHAIDLTAPESSSAMHIPMRAADTNIIYVKMRLEKLRGFVSAVKPGIKFTRQAVIDKNNLVDIIALSITVSVVFFFMLSNLYLFISFRDRPILYYLAMQLGGILYVTSFPSFYHVRTISLFVYHGGRIFAYDYKNVIQHTGILLVIFGLTNFTRLYLNTKKHLPRMDAVLAGALYFYMAASTILLIINCNGLVLEPLTIIPENVFLGLFMCFMLAMVITLYRRKVKGSRVFLLAYTFPLYITIGITLYHIFITTDETTNWVAEMAVLSEAFGFSAALAARTKQMQNDLKAKELEAQQLSFELKEIALQHSLVELENQKVNLSIQHEKARNELLRQKLETNQRELASTTLYMVQKNELLATLRAEIEELNKQYPKNKHKSLSSIETILQSNLYLDSDWNKFRLHFEQVHPDFFEELSAKHPSLTKNEIRLAAYFHINLSTKEIAALLNIAPASVRRAKTRLYKKIGKEAQLSPDELQGEADEEAI